MLKNYIDGHWVASAATTTSPVNNPATGKIIAECPLSTHRDVDAAVLAANRAFATWKQVPASERCQYLFRLKYKMEENLPELSALLTQEHGKTLGEARASIQRGIQMLETACGIPSLLMGNNFADIARGIDSSTVNRPLGVFTAIAPFNFPVMVPFWFWPFAIACGNTFVLKPSERVPLSSQRIFELLDELKLPPGVMNLLHGGKEVAEELCRHPLVKGISFVGSTPVARHIYQLGCQHGKRVQALGGAKNLMVVLPDAMQESTRARTVATAVESISGCSGQRCLAGSLVLGVGRSTYTELCEDAVAQVSRIVVGNGAEPGVTMGPMISQAAKERVVGLIDRAEAAGAKLLLDGRHSLDHLPGYFLAPTVLAGITQEMEIAREEVFGPVVLLGEATDFAHAIQWINQLEVANTTTLFTNSGAAARQFVMEVDPSMIGINIGVPAPMAFFSFGGSKQSFFGDIKAHGSDCIKFYSEPCTTVYRWYSDSSIW
jgi:malonate-semialdehyde dehydrogenase (acetylating)/methylmalonate-semialdehyde dehydrogenase